jgi:hypothetical protein
MSVQWYASAGRFGFAYCCDRCGMKPKGSPCFRHEADAEHWINGTDAKDVFHITSVNRQVWCVRCVDAVIEEMSEAQLET